MNRSLVGMCVAITGASSGIGRALAVELAQRGARLALAARNEAALHALNHELGGNHVVYGCDVAIPEQCAAFVTHAHAHLGRIDTLICNAGIGLFRKVSDTTTAEWQHLWNVNVMGTAECLRTAVPLMLSQTLRDGWRGQIVITSSVLGLRGIPHYGTYCATKAAQLMLAQSARVELAADRIAVTSVHPARTLTAFNANAETLSGQRKKEPSRWEPGQSAESVAQAIIKSLVKPRAEVWPQFGSRLIFHWMAWWPHLADAILSRHKRIE